MLQRNLQQKVGDITYIYFDLSCPLNLLAYPQGGGEEIVKKMKFAQ